LALLQELLALTAPSALMDCIATNNRNVPLKKPLEPLALERNSATMMTSLVACCTAVVLLELARNSSLLPLVVLATTMPCVVLASSANFPPPRLAFVLRLLLLPFPATGLKEPTTTPIAPQTMVLDLNAIATISMAVITIVITTGDSSLLLALPLLLIRLLLASLPTSAFKVRACWTVVLVLKRNAPRKAAAC
jgi:hypothetical protein